MGAYSVLAWAGWVEGEAGVHFWGRLPVVQLWEPPALVTIPFCSPKPLIM